MLTTKSNSYTFQKSGVWYFSRRVPTDLRRHYRTGRIALKGNKTATIRRRINNLPAIMSYAYSELDFKKWGQRDDCCGSYCRAFDDLSFGVPVVGRGSLQSTTVSLRFLSWTWSRWKSNMHHRCNNFPFTFSSFRQSVLQMRCGSWINRIEHYS